MISKYRENEQIKSPKSMLIEIGFPSHRHANYVFVNKFGNVTFSIHSIRVVVEDKESSGGTFSIKVSPTCTIERLQQEVTTHFYLLLVLPGYKELVFFIDLLKLENFSLRKTLS